MMSRTWWSSRSTSRTPTARIGSPTTTGARARTSRSAGCTSPPCPTKRRRTPTRSSSGRARTRSRSSCATSRPARRKRRYHSSLRTIEDIPPIRRDLIQRSRYLVPNSIVVSRGCPHHCTFCYKDAFFEGGRSFYTQRVDDALAEIARLPGRHLYFLDDHLLGNRRFSRELFTGMRGMNRVFQGAATVDSILRDDTIELAARAGLRSLFVGFETLSTSGLAGRRQETEPWQRLSRRDPAARRSRHHDQRQLRVRARRRGSGCVRAHGRLGGRERHHHRHVSHRHAVPGHAALFGDGGAETADDEQLGSATTRATSSIEPLGITPEALKAGYDWAYREFYRWGNIFTAARAHQSSKHSLKHLAYSAGWKKFEPAWDFVIRLKQLSQMRPMLEAVLSPVAGPSTRAATTRTSLRTGKTPGPEHGADAVRSSVPESA